MNRRTQGKIAPGRFYSGNQPSGNTCRREDPGGRRAIKTVSTISHGYAAWWMRTRAPRT
jgi:hypothetical protein